MRDTIGKEIRVGDHIAYAVRRGNVAVLKTGSVIASRRDGSGIVVDAIGNSKAALLENGERIVVVGHP